MKKINEELHMSGTSSTAAPRTGGVTADQVGGYRVEGGQLGCILVDKKSCPGHEQKQPRSIL